MQKIIVMDLSSLVIILQKTLLMSNQLFCTSLVANEIVDLFRKTYTPKCFVCVIFSFPHLSNQNGHYTLYNTRSNLRKEHINILWS